MQSFEDYDAKTTSPYEVLVHLQDLVLSGRLASFTALAEYAAPLPDDGRTANLLHRAFDLQRRLSWGFFRGLSPDAYPQLWRLLVVPDRKHAFAGDLKRIVATPELALAIVDMHGYTKFCQKNRHNMAMVDFLDKVIFEDMPRVAARSGVISKRAYGDQILLVGASVGSVLETTLRIRDYLSKDLKAKVASNLLLKSEGVFLPEFQISAGITGGQKYASLVVTRDGDVSGDLVNTAARLQARANKISPDHTKILLSSHAYHRIKAKVEAGTIEFPRAIKFFNAGPVDFKGVSLPVFEVAFPDREAYRFAYHDLMERLYISLRKQLWRSKIFEDALAVTAAMVLHFPDPTLDKSRLLTLIRAGVDLYQEDQFEKAVDHLDRVVQALGILRTTDPLVLEYLERILESYRLILEGFFQAVDRELEDRRTELYTSKERQNLEVLARHHALFESARAEGRYRVRQRRLVWQQVAEALSPSLEARINSMK